MVGTSTAERILQTNIIFQLNPPYLVSELGKECSCLMFLLPFETGRRPLLPFETDRRPLHPSPSENISEEGCSFARTRPWSRKGVFLCLRPSVLPSDAPGSDPPCRGSAPACLGFAPPCLGSAPTSLGSAPLCLGSAPVCFQSTPFFFYPC